MNITKIILWLFVIVVVGFLGLNLWIIAGMPSARDRRLPCVNNLKGIGKVWQFSYLSEDPEFKNPPKSLFEMLKLQENQIPVEHQGDFIKVVRKLCKCPVVKESKDSSYFYYGHLLNSKYTHLKRTVLVCDNSPDNHEGVINILMADGKTIIEAEAENIEDACQKYNLILPKRNSLDSQQ